MPLRVDTNPLFTQAAGVVEVERLRSPTSHRRKLNTARRQLRDVRKVQTAAAAIAGLDHHHEIIGFTNGQFSLLDLLAAVFALTGPAHLSIPPWTAAPHEIQSIGAMLQRGDITGSRWLIDFSMSRRDPAATSQLRDTVGRDAVRVCKNHSKFAIFQNADWKVVLRSSMNLNMNPRFEDFQIAHDPELAGFLNTILDEIWAKQPKGLADERPYEICKYFDQEM